MVCVCLMKVCVSDEAVSCVSVLMSITAVVGLGFMLVNYRERNRDVEERKKKTTKPVLDTVIIVLLF